MRTTINIDDQIFIEAKRFAIESHKSFANIVEDALRSTLALKNTEKTNIVSLQTMNGNGLRHGVDLDNGQSLTDIMDGI